MYGCICNCCIHNDPSPCTAGHKAPVIKQGVCTCYRGAPGHKSYYEGRLQDGMTPRQALVETLRWKGED